MSSTSERENREIEAANNSGATPVVFIHGLWLLPTSWANWADFFEQAGYAPLTPDWPDDPQTVEEARANPDILAKKTLEQVADHTAEVIGVNVPTAAFAELEADVLRWADVVPGKARLTRFVVPRELSSVRRLRT